ncbi:MAG: hypothetical protein Q9205_007193 [Flavoplaca limonia]
MGISWEWGIVCGCVVVYVALFESWKATKRAFAIGSAKHLKLTTIEGDTPARKDSSTTAEKVPQEAGPQRWMMILREEIRFFNGNSSKGKGFMEGGLNDGNWVLLRHAVAFMNGRKTVLPLTATEKLDRLWRICLADALAINVPYRETLRYGDRKDLILALGNLQRNVNALYNTNNTSSTGAHEGYGHDQHGQQTPYGQSVLFYGHQQQGYGAPPPPRPSLPPGWVSQWDHNSQQTYYLQQATGRTQWDPPQAQHGGPPPGMGDGYGSAPGHGLPGGLYSQRYNQYTDSYGNQHRELHEKKWKSGKGGILAAGAGGLAVSVLLVAR